MLEQDNLTYSYQKRTLDKSAERVLITLERSQKLDLLLHLLTNLRQSLVICGPDGIGKSTLLNTLQESRQNDWHFCRLSGSSALSFEAVMDQLSRSVDLKGSGSGNDLSTLRAFCNQQHVVLVIDDAGGLLPGLIGELSNFAESLNGLRLVLAMTSDEFQQKSATDPTLDACHVIEIPPLTRKQCVDYLQNLSAQRNSLLSFNAITDPLVDALYLETHGIPGRLLAELPKLNQYQTRPHRKVGLWLGVLVIILGAGYAIHAFLPKDFSLETKNAPSQTLVSTDSPPKPSVQIEVQPSQAGTAALATVIVPTAPTDASAEIKPSNASLTPGVTPTVNPVSPATPASTPVSAPETSNAPVPPPAGNQIPVTPTVPLATNKPAEPAPVKTVPQTEPQKAVKEEPVTRIKSEPVTEKATVGTPAVIDKKASDSAAKSSAGDEENLAWIMSQPANRYTLQVMTLSTKDAVRRFMKKYADYGESLKYYTVTKNDQEKFILIYGSFESATEARQYKEVMPGEFKQALEKRFTAVQKESRR